MPPDKQRTPFSCMLDGLQVSSGATLGKQNIRFAYSAEVLSATWPVIHVVRSQDAQRGPAGLSYQARPRLHDWLRTVVPERLEEMSRELAHIPVEELFDIRELTEPELLPQS
jgi:formylmethanofuran dehydrogenase subunit E